MTTLILAGLCCIISFVLYSSQDFRPRSRAVDSMEMLPAVAIRDQRSALSRYAPERDHDWNKIVSSRPDIS